jgi:DNA polymerase III delta prime subunit
MSSDKKALWSEKHRPHTLNEYVFHDPSHKAAFEQMIKDKSIPHLLLSGVQGTGKTTLSLILTEEMGIDPTDVLVINSSDENSVDDVRDKIKNFISTYAFGNFKIVRLEEADYLSLAAQGVLRGMLQDYAHNARFIFTCNYENKLIPAIKSRLQQYRFKAPPRDDVLEFAATVLIKENVKFDLDLLEKYVAVGYPDVRQIINLLQGNAINGVLVDTKQQAQGADYKFKLLDTLETGDWEATRKVCCGNVAAEEWEDVYRFLYENLNKSKKFTKIEKWEQGIVIIADHLVKHALVSDSEINAAAMFIKLGQV